MSDGHTQRLESALAGRYKIQRKLGEGGMASVYLAEDIKHERKVALKILKPELAAVIGAERFLTEIKTTANLQHPHILPLFDSGEADSFLYYVMPYIEGENLRDRIEREGQLGVEEAVRIARDVADALDYAHRNDIIHRDIKPANILLHDGRPVVADFGIALAISAAGGGRMTETGLSLGTPHYMSPEQASADRDLSARSDVYSLGCVLYEMLAGQPPHTGPSAQSILVRILTEDPRTVTELRRTVPPHVAATVMKSIEKLPADRFDTAKQFMDALQDTAFSYTPTPRAQTTTTPAAARSTASSAPRLHSAVTGLLAVATLVLGWMALGAGEGRDGADAPVVSFVMAEDLPYNLPALAVARDGAVLASLDNERGLLLRAPGALEEVPLAGTHFTSAADFSPQGDWIAFSQFETEPSVFILKRVPARGGPISTLWAPDAGREGPVALEWGDDGWIYAVTGDDRIVRIPQEGGAPEELLALQGSGARELLLLPGGRGLAFTLNTGFSSAANRIVLMELATGDTATIVEDGFDAEWADTGHLIYAHGGGALYALPFDPRRLEATGAPVPVLDDVATWGRLSGRYALAPGGTLVYTQGTAVGGDASGGMVFSLLDPSGGRTTLPLDPTDHPDGALSPDGGTLAYTRNDHIWLYDLDLGSNRQLTTEGSNHHNPVWSPDGSEVAFESRHEGDTSGDIYAQAVDGSAPARRVGGTDSSDTPVQWLSDGTILFDIDITQESSDIYRIDADGGGEPVPVLYADWDEINPQVSPDGEWIAFGSTEGGSAEIYLRRWPSLADKIQVTDEGRFVFGSSQLVWGPGSRTLYFRYGGEILAATLAADGSPSVEVRQTGLQQFTDRIHNAHPDGRLLAAGQPSTADSQEGATARLVVVTNWLTQLRERFGGGGR